VREGYRVKEGDIVVRLDETQTKANLLIVTKSLDELAARQAREEAERDGADQVLFPRDLLARMDDPDVAHVVSEERKLFAIRREAREGQKAQLRERIAQLKEEIRGYEAQQVSKDEQIDWIKKELAGVNALWQKNLIPYTRVTSLERDRVRLEGERGQLIASIAQAKGKITETELQIIQVDQDMRTEVGKDLAEIRAKTSELVEKKVAAEDQAIPDSEIVRLGGSQARAWNAGWSFHSNHPPDYDFLSRQANPRSSHKGVPRKVIATRAGLFWHSRILPILARPARAASWLVCSTAKQSDRRRWIRIMQPRLGQGIIENRPDGCKN
jgi:multidrug efflux pump subunit AcrA (membrane-fusion protein)